jgi:hypothetical protein
MRAFGLAAILIVTGCARDALDDTTYRRLVDEFDTYDQCLRDGDFSPCYNTLTFCADGRVNANLDYRQEGTYQIRKGTMAIVRLPTVTVFFDLPTASSPQLPGRHPWEVVDPLSVDCAP